MPYLFALLMGFTGLSAMAQELLTTPEDREALSLTVYSDDLALVRDRRRVRMLSGQIDLAFTGISARIRPETARLYSDSPVKVLAQNFDYALLTPQSLLEKAVGREIQVARIDPVSGEQQRLDATVLAVTDGQTVFRIGPRIETSGPLSPWRFIFNELPEGLRERPTLTLELDSPRGGEQALELVYLSRGLSWRADYLATLNAAEDALSLTAWATVDNQSGSAYPQAQLQLVAGQVNQLPQEPPPPPGMVRMAMASAPEDAMASETLFEYPLYTLERPVTLAERQSKQVLMFETGPTPVSRRYRVQALPAYYGLQPGIQELPVTTLLHLENRKPQLGRPLPAGALRVYRHDAEGRVQFVGEQAIGHTPEGRELEVALGGAFEITARRRQTDYKQPSRESSEAAFELELHNAKAEAVAVEVLETLGGDWRIVQESHPHRRQTASQVTWTVNVPAGGKATLSYRVRNR